MDKPIYVSYEDTVEVKFFGHERCLVRWAAFLQVHSQKKKCKIQNILLCPSLQMMEIN